MKPRPRALLAIGAAAIVAGTTVVLVRPAYAAGVTATVVKTSNWGTGFEGKGTITNGGPSVITSWTVAFDLPAGTTISSSWDSVRTQSGNRYTFANAGWNGTVPVGGSVTFGFIGAGSGDPSNCTVNGASCGGGPTTPPTTGPADTQPPTVPTGLSGTASSNTQINLSWNASTDNVGVTGYDIERDGAVVGSSSSTSFADSGLARNSLHTYRVRAKDARNNRSAFSASIQVRTRNDDVQPPGGMRVAPYFFPGFGLPLPNPATVMQASGVRWFTIAFVLASGCNAVWDGEGGLTGGQHQATINQIRAAGGDIIPSFGGFNGPKLGPACGTPQLLANQYMRVIDQFNLRAIDIDIENFDEFENDAVRNRIIGALKIVKQQRPGVTTIVTIPTLINGPNFFGGQLIQQAAATQANIDIFTIMPFNFGGHGNMVNATASAVNGLRSQLMSAFGWSASTANSHMGISGMNGLSDQRETTTLADWRTIISQQSSLARVSFWGVNRDRPCPDGGVTSSCSGIGGHADWDFTRATNGR
jgi:Cellulose binding domain